MGRRLVCAGAVLVLLVGPLALVFAIAKSRGEPLLVLAAAALSVLVVGAGVVVGELVWPERSVAQSLGVIAAAFVCAVFTAFVGFLVTYLITINSSLCGSSGDGLSGAASVAEGAVYLIVGGWSFRRPNRPLWGLPLAVLAALAAGLAVQAIDPGGHGFCET